MVVPLMLLTLYGNSPPARKLASAPLRADSTGWARMEAEPFCSIRRSCALSPVLIADSTFRLDGNGTGPPLPSGLMIGGAFSLPARRSICSGALPRRPGIQMPPTAAPPVAFQASPTSRSMLIGNSTICTSMTIIFSQPTGLVKLMICG